MTDAPAKASTQPPASDEGARFRRALDEIAQLAADLLAATHPSSTAGDRARLRQDLLGRGLLMPTPPAIVDRDRLLSLSVDELDLSVRASNFLLGAGITTLRDLTRMTQADLASIKWSSARIVRDIREELARIGLALAPPTPAPAATPTPRPRRSRRRATRGGRG